MQDFPANSAKARARPEDPTRERPEKVERIVTGEVDRRKRGLGHKFKEAFIGGTARGAMEYVVTDVVVPTVRDLIFESFQGGVERWVYGESRIRRGSSPPTGPNQPYVDYGGISRNRPPTSSGTRALSRRSRARQNFDEIVIPSRQEASDVLDRMYDELSRYGRVSVSVLYELTGIQSSHQDHKWGWTQLRGANVARLRNGTFLLDLPEPEAFT